MSSEIMIGNSILARSNNLKTFAEIVAVHQHNAIKNDLSELFSDGFSIRSSISEVTPNSSNSSSNSGLGSVMSPAINAEGKVCQVSIFSTISLE